MASIVNLTPHPVNVVGEDGELVASFPSEGIARAAQTDQLVARPAVDGGYLVDDQGNDYPVEVKVPIVKTTFGEVVDLPEPQEGVMLIVSIITLNAARAGGRPTDDLLMTSALVRDETGRIIGCKALGRA